MLYLLTIGGKIQGYTQERGLLSLYNQLEALILKRVNGNEFTFIMGVPDYSTISRNLREGNVSEFRVIIDGDPSKGEKIQIEKINPIEQ